MVCHDLFKPFIILSVRVGRQVCVCAEVLDKNLTRWSCLFQLGYGEGKTCGTGHRPFIWLCKWGWIKPTSLSILHFRTRAMEAKVITLTSGFLQLPGSVQGKGETVSMNPNVNVILFLLWWDGDTQYLRIWDCGQEMWETSCSLRWSSVLSGVALVDGFCG